MKPHESHKSSKLSFEEVLEKQKTLARMYQMSNTGSVHEAMKSEKLKKNDEFAHVKMPPLSILNEKTALELTTLFLQRFQSMEAQNGRFGTDVRFPLVKLTFVSPQKWIFNGNWTPMGGVTLRPSKRSSK